MLSASAPASPANGLIGKNLPAGFGVLRENAMPSNGGEIGLVDFIHSLRAELAEAVDRAAGEKLQLQATKIDLELQLPAEKSGGPNAKAL